LASFTLFSFTLVPIEGCLLHWNQYDTFIFSILVPVVLFAASAIVIFVIYGYKLWKKVNPSEIICRDCVTYFIVCNLVIFFQMYPRLVLESFQILNCIPVGTNYYLVADLSIQCYTSAYSGAEAVAILVIIIYGILIPLGVAYYIWKQRAQKSKDSSLLLKRFGFFYGKYKENYFYWDIVDLFTKLILAVVLVYADSILVKLTVILFIFLTIIITELQIRPFIEDKHNYSALLTFIAVFFTITCGLYFYDNGLIEFGYYFDLAAVDIIVLLVNISALGAIFVLFCISTLNNVKKHLVYTSKPTAENL